MPKLPFMLFYTKDWLNDTRRLNPATKGHWIDLLCAMWDDQQSGLLNWTLSAYSRYLGVSVVSARDILSELLDTKTADGGFHQPVDKPVDKPVDNCPTDCLSNHFGDKEDIRSGVSYGYVTNCHQHVTVINRRMYNAANERNRKNKNKQDSRRRQNVTGNVTAKSQNVTDYNSYIISHIKNKSTVADRSPPVDKSKESEQSPARKPVLFYKKNQGGEMQEKQKQELFELAKDLAHGERQKEEDITKWLLKTTREGIKAKEPEDRVINVQLKCLGRLKNLDLSHREMYAYLTKAYEKIRTEVIQAESEHYKQNGFEPIGGILARLEHEPAQDDDVP